jgi:chemotaxis protein CheX
MKVELIQPFVSSADSVLGMVLEGPTQVGDLTMEGEVYRRKGVAAVITFEGDIEGRIIFDLDPETALRVACYLAGGDVESSDEIVRETLCEIANMITGNAVTLLNDQGYHFRVHPPEIHTDPEGLKNSQDTEALVMSFETPNGIVYMNIAMRYNRRRRREREEVTAD